VDLRFYPDPETAEPHIYNHGVSEEEVEEVLEDPSEERPGKNNARSGARKRLRDHRLRPAGQTPGRLPAPPAAQDETPMKKKAKTRFPPGWDEQRVREVLEHYESQSEDEAVAEDEAAFERAHETMMAIPHDLVPAVRELISEYEEEHRAS